MAGFASLKLNCSQAIAGNNNCLNTNVYCDNKFATNCLYNETTFSCNGCMNYTLEPS